jgi:predicted RNA methylase
VLDLGAGTGKLTGTLVALGADVIAVEPDPAGPLAGTTRMSRLALHILAAEDLPVVLPKPHRPVVNVLPRNY